MSRFVIAAASLAAAALATRGVYVSVRGDRLRVTPHLYNDEEDITRFVEALRAA